MKKILLLSGILSAALFSSQNIVLAEFASGLTSPVEIVNANDNRLFVVQQNGIIQIIQPNGTVNSTAFLNISTKITFNGERGLLGLAFHPQYATNGYFFVFYNNTAGNITVARYSVNSADPNTADPTSEKTVLNITKPFENHNGGSIHFAPDGKLWISTGDGGSAGDPNNNSQNKNSLLGKILRIDVNSTAAYTIPPDNPFVGIDGADEIWSYGLRNAWKFSFDLATGNAMIADVGQSQTEEINRMPITQAGINYGWRCYEGNSAYNTTGCANSSTMTFPIAVYNHTGGKCSITGGYVYRGTAYPALTGKYIFADYCSTQIGILNADNSIVWTSAFTGNNFATFGEDSGKELYVAAVNNGKIYKISTTTLATGEHPQNSFKIYPSPASGKIFIDGLKTRNNTAEINNAEGRKVLETKVKEDQSIDISTLKSGIYFITISSDHLKIYSQKVIIK
ncbi:MULTISPECIES: PQQ-dependent sugar dehydrogenase [Chryseobacterium]|uniref:Quinoprotein glucose dehydrogenase B n=1 Tax=Chryseobacterium salivictor TaxID=2547600 RepID=A0A4P6ZFQ2_9FLAO|nr:MULTISPECIES: PQQ-dependent sugar dehydrogenase [Chryseobacterium]MDQ0477969.1 glucose/arabinose dehydrogenase [Chryseobacterium sp. MDT2-18]QBO58441.1 Quinoprotein glucose dehydrogenase B [Chryseobacterium salivictor]